MRCAWLVVVASLAACYSYRPISAPGPDPGARISASLTQEGAMAMLAVLGPEVSEIRGRVVDADRDTLRVSLASVTSVRGVPTSWSGEEVPLLRSRLASVGERRLAPGGTVLLGAGVVGGLYFLYRLLGGPGLFEGSSGRGGGGKQ